MGGSAKDINIWISLFFSSQRVNLSATASNDQKHKWKLWKIVFFTTVIFPFSLIIFFFFQTESRGEGVGGGWERGQEKEVFSSHRPLCLSHPWASASSPRYSFAFGADHNPISFCPSTSSFSPNVSHKVLLLGACSPTSLPHYSLLMGFHVELTTLRNARLFWVVGLNVKNTPIYSIY